MYHNKKGEIATFISIATLIAISVFTFVTANINTNTAQKETVNTKAAEICDGTPIKQCSTGSYYSYRDACCTTSWQCIGSEWDPDFGPVCNTESDYPSLSGDSCCGEVDSCEYYYYGCAESEYTYAENQGCCVTVADPEMQYVDNSSYTESVNTCTGNGVCLPQTCDGTGRTDLSYAYSCGTDNDNVCCSTYVNDDYVGNTYLEYNDYIGNIDTCTDNGICLSQPCSSTGRTDLSAIYSCGNNTDSYCCSAVASDDSIPDYYCNEGFCVYGASLCPSNYDSVGQTCLSSINGSGVCCKNKTYNSNENCNSSGGQCILGSCDGAEMDVVSGGICGTSEYSCCKNKTIYDNLIKNFNQLFPSDDNTVKTTENTCTAGGCIDNASCASRNMEDVPGQSCGISGWSCCTEKTCTSGGCIDSPSCSLRGMIDVPGESCGISGWSCCTDKDSGNKPWTYTTCECNDDGYWNDNCTDKKGKPCEDPTKESSTNTCQDLSGICVNESAIMDSKYETVSGGGGCPSAYVCVKLKIASKPSGQEGTTPYIPPGNVPEKPVPAGANPAASNPAAGKGDGSPAPGENKGSGASDQGNKLTPTTNPIVSNSNIGGCVSPNQCMASSALGCRIGGDVLPVPCSSGQAYTGNQYNAATGNFCQIGNTTIQAPCVTGQVWTGINNMPGTACNFGGQVVQTPCQTGQNVAANQTATGTTCFIGGTPIPYSCTIGQPTIGVNGVYGSACNFNGMVVQASCATSMGIPGNQNYSGSACQIGGKVVQVPCSAGIPAQLQANITSCQNGGSAVSLTCPTAGQICCAQPNILQGLTGTLSTALGTLMNRLINPVPSLSSPSTSSTSTSSNGSITPTLTPTPTSTPTQGGLDNPNGVDVTFDMKLKFHGITTTPKSELNRMRVQVTIVDTSVMSGTRTAVQTGEFTASGSAAIWTGSVKFTKVEPKKTYQLLVKGPKHVQKRICTNSPTETAAGSYSCKELLDVVAGSNSLDLSNIYMMAGDVPKQDGMVNSVDFGVVRTKFGSLDYTSLETADLNIDGAINSVDFSLILQTLQTTDGIDQK